jgi:hypothetical protein
MPRVLERNVQPPVAPEFADAMTFANDIRRLMATPKARDKQVKIGPSGIGNPCDWCVAQTMSHMLPGSTKRVEETSIMSLVGTTMHDFMEGIIEAQNWPGVSTEIKLNCGEIQGYGSVDGHITGHTDLYNELLGLIVDWKFVGPATFKKMKSKGMPIQYRTQRHVYGAGVKRAGLPINQVMNFVVPLGRGLAKVDDILIEVENFDQSVADLAFERAQIIWDDYVLQGAVDELQKDPDCFECSGISELF